MTLSERLITARGVLRMTQQELADLLGVTKMTIFNWEHGHADAMPLRALQILWDRGINLMSEMVVRDQK